MIKVTLILTVLLFHFSSLGIGVKEVIQKMQKVYAQKGNLEYYTSYELFKGHVSNEVVESYKGYVYKSGSNIYQKIDQSEFVYAKDFFVQTSIEEKVIGLSNPQRTTFSTIDLDQALKVCSKMELDENKGYYGITLIIKNSADLPFSVLKMRIDSKKYYLERLDIYYTDVMDFAVEGNNPEMDKSHLKITFSKPDASVKEKDYFDLNRYFVKSNEGKYTPTNLYLNFEFIDNRKSY